MQSWIFPSHPSRFRAQRRAQIDLSPGLVRSTCRPLRLSILKISTRLSQVKPELIQNLLCDAHPRLKELIRICDNSKDKGAIMPNRLKVIRTVASLRRALEPYRKRRTRVALV